jgi:hypothetical protein
MSTRESAPLKFIELTKRGDGLWNYALRDAEYHAIAMRLGVTGKVAAELVSDLTADGHPD